MQHAPVQIVLTGVDGGKVYFDDPDGGVKKERTIKWFKEKLFTQWIGCVMVKDPVRLLIGNAGQPHPRRSPSSGGRTSSG